MFFIFVVLFSTSQLRMIRHSAKTSSRFLKSESFRLLKKGLDYGLSVAMVADPQKGRKLLEKLLQVPDSDIKWILRENLKKKRVERMDRDWMDKMIKAIT